MEQYLTQGYIFFISLWFVMVLSPCSTTVNR